MFRSSRDRYNKCHSQVDLVPQPSEKGEGGLWIVPHGSLGICVKLFTQKHKQEPGNTCPLAFSESACRAPGLGTAELEEPCHVLPGAPQRYCMASTLRRHTGQGKERRREPFVCTLFFVMDTARVCRLQ